MAMDARQIVVALTALSREPVRRVGTGQGCGYRRRRLGGWPILRRRGRPGRQWQCALCGPRRRGGRRPGELARGRRRRRLRYRRHGELVDRQCRHRLGLRRGARPSRRLRRLARRLRGRQRLLLLGLAIGLGRRNRARGLRFGWRTDPRRILQADIRRRAVEHDHDRLFLRFGRLQGRKPPDTEPDQRMQDHCQGHGGRRHGLLHA